MRDLVVRNSTISRCLCTTLPPHVIRRRWRTVRGNQVQVVLCASLLPEQILDLVAHDAESALHPSCTAKMGIDPTFVTGPQRMGVHDEGGDLILGNRRLAPVTVPFYRHQPRVSESVSRS
jgi:hypothetical protein